MRRSEAPQLKLRLTLAALLLTIGGKVLGVLAPLLLGRRSTSWRKGRGRGARSDWPSPAWPSAGP